MTTTVVFDHRNRTEKGCPGPLEVRITIDRKPYYVNTGIKVLKSEWHFGTIINRPDANELNERLSIVLCKVEKEINKCLSESRPIDVSAIKKSVLCSNQEALQNDKSFLYWCEDNIELLPIAEGTKKHYRTLYKRLEEYGKMTAWYQLNTDNILRFDAWLKNANKKQSCNLDFAKRPFSENREKKIKKISTAGIYTYHKCLKALLNRAFIVGKITSNPYDRLRGQIKRGEKENIEYLTEEEMEKIQNLNLEGGVLSIARDLFVFQMFTGMAYSDAMAFDINDYKLTNGKWINRQERIKTGVPFVNQLLPPVVKVLEKYDMQVPRLDQSDYNGALKLIGEACGISTRMHSHLARHTFATFMLRNGAKIENVQKMLGHNSIVTTQKYAKVLAQSVHDDFSMIEEKLKKGS